MARVALLVVGLVSVAACRKSETRHEVTGTRVVDAAAAVAPAPAVDAAPALARPAADVTRVPTRAVLDAEECAITSRYRPLKFGHAPRWLAAVGDERHLVVAVDDGPGALLAYRAAPTGQVPGELRTATSEGADRMLAAEAVGDLTLILFDGRCGRTRACTWWCWTPRPTCWARARTWPCPAR
ncbi:MAG: hypothetical protein IPL61_15910 [Myxococcales bacterium]|nr:hypothetical protein [Myxococcales bacterium]